VIANNLANMNTTAYKMQRAEFQDLLYQNSSGRLGLGRHGCGLAGRDSDRRGRARRGDLPDHGQGNIATTGNPYDSR